MFFCDWCDYEGPVGTPGEFEINTIGKIHFYENGWPTMAQNAANGTLLLQWGNGFFPENIYKDEVEIYSLWLCKENAGDINNTREIWWLGLLDCDNSIKNITGSVQDINIYPNPTTGELTMDNGQLTMNNEQLIMNNIELFDIYGRKQNVEFHSYGLTVLCSYGLSNLPAGIYFVKITTEEGVVVKKVIKQ